MTPAQTRSQSPEMMRGKRSAVQRDLVRVRQIRDGVLSVAPRHVAGRPVAQRERSVTVIEVPGTNFTLRSEDDRALLVCGYQSLLKALPPGHSLQILVRRLPRDLSDYLTALSSVANDPTAPDRYRDLADAHADHVERLAGDRTLFDSRFYLIVGAEDESRLSVAERFFKRRARLTRERGAAAARLDLDIQVERILSALADVDLSAHRLSDLELALLAASCLAPMRAERFPLPIETLSAVGYPVRPRGSDPAESLPLRPPDDEQDSRSRDALPEPGWQELPDLIAPSAVVERPDHLLIDGEYLRGIAITGYPREVTMGWLAPLMTHDDSIDISIHTHMQHPLVMLRRYRRRKAELRANRRLAARKGWVDNPDDQVAASDIERLLLQVASREEMLCEVGMYVQVRAPNLATLDERTDRLLSLVKNLFLVAHPTTFEQLAAWQAMQPIGDDALRRTTLLDTMSQAYGFPFISNALSMPGGVLEGVSQTGEPVIIDDWGDALDNPHRFIGATTGGGKSFYCKLKMMRELLVRYGEGLQVAVIDPEQEYEQICRELGGTFVRLAPGSAQHLNPFDLLPQGIDLAAYLADRLRGDRLAEKVQFLHAYYDLKLSDRGPTGVTMLSVREKGLLDRATYEAYRRKGITSDPATHSNPAPVLRDLYEVLASGDVGKDEYGLCDRLFRYVEGSLAGMFSAPTDVALDNRFVVFDVRDMSGELRPIGILLIADFMWTQMLASPRPRVLYIDEAWSLIQHPEGGRFLADLSRRARKRYLRIVTITQSPELFVADQYGAVIAGNAATKILKKQDRTSAPAIAARFGLTLSERQKLLTLQRTEALLLTGGKRLVITIEANPLEYQLATTNPRDLALREREGR
jgi:hypothetical protein